MFLDFTEFHQQQGMVMARMAQHERRYCQKVDTTDVLNTLSYLITRTDADSVVGDALLTAQLAIEADIDRHMKEDAQGDAL